MGLDSVELVISFEETFQISIPNTEAEKMRTPRNVIDFITSAFGTRVEGPAVVMPKRHADLWAQLECAMRSSGMAGKSLRVDQRLDEVFVNRGSRRQDWSKLRRQMNVKEWPSLRWLGLSTDFPAHLHMLGDLVDWLSCNRPQILTAEELQALTREDIALFVKNIVLYQIGISEEKYGEDKRFVEDMGVD